MFPVMRLYDDMVSQLRCTNCNAYWKIRPIEMCGEGHSICHSCQAHILPSENCRAQPSNVTNVALERIVQTAIYLCPFALSDGEPCTWSGIPFDIMEHVRLLHDIKRVTGTGENEWIRLSLPFEKVIITLDELFFPLSSITTEGLCFAVFHVGHKDHSSGYRYDFRMQNSDDSRKSYSEESNTCHNYMKNRNEVEVSGDFVILCRDSMQKYVPDGHAVSCDIKIKRKGTSQDVDMTEPAENVTLLAESSDDVPEDNYCP